MNQAKIGKYILQKRKEMEMTREDLAAAIGVTNRTIRHWESGKYIPDYLVIDDLCEELDISVAELINGTDRPDKSIHLYDEDEIKELLEDVQKTEKQNNILFIMLLSTIFLVFAKTFAHTILGTILTVLTFLTATVAIVLTLKK
ncbi:MAG: helix-turn-helix transcriptional regulator [Firmicutes bacterium]|nr:helix-turn-helix transcriptional regulator [Bacillota bacterium]